MMSDRFISFIRRKILRISKFRWDYQYSEGRYDWVRKEEMKRLYEARELMDKYLHGGKIFDIGCGEGLFLEVIADLNYSFYEGIDISEVAIGKIKTTGKCLLKVADMEKYVPANSPFSVIVINEVLYYSKNPVELLKRQSGFLESEGVFLIGMFDTKKSTEIWSKLDQDFVVIDSVRIEQKEKTWSYRIIKPILKKN